MVPFTRCAVVRERGLSSGSVGLASGGYLGTRILSSPRAGVWVACGTSVAPSDHSDTVLTVCLRVRQSGALRVFVALGRFFDFGALFWICGPRLLNVATGGVWDLFVLLPKIFGCWFFFARAFLLGRLVYFTS